MSATPKMRFPWKPTFAELAGDRLVTERKEREMTCLVSRTADAAAKKPVAPFDPAKRRAR